MRPVSFRCTYGFHRFDEVDEFGRCWCSRCGIRKPVYFETIQTEEQRGRELNRPKTRGAKR